MLHDLDTTLQKLIYEYGRLNKNEVDVAFELPTSEWAARLSRPTINCWCFDLHENVKLRNMDMRVTKGDGRAALQLAPMRFNITYLVTAWAREIEDEHRLLWRALAALARTPVLDPTTCDGELRDQPYDIPILVGQLSDIGVNFTDLWGVIESEMRLGFTARITLALDTQRGFDEPLVLEKRIGVGQAERPRERRLTALDRTLVQTTKDRKSKGDDE